MFFAARCPLKLQHIKRFMDPSHPPAAGAATFLLAFLLYLASYGQPKAGALL